MNDVFRLTPSLSSHIFNRKPEASGQLPPQVKLTGNEITATNEKDKLIELEATRPRRGLFEIGDKIYMLPQQVLDAYRM